MPRDQSSHPTGRVRCVQLERDVAVVLRSADRGGDADPGGQTQAPGEGGAAPRDRGAQTPGRPGSKPLVRPTERTVELILASLATPADRATIVERSGLSPAGVWHATRWLHYEGAIHVCRWIPQAAGGAPYAVYAAGPGEDAPCDFKRSASGYRQAKSRDRKRNGTRVEVRRDPMIEALFGPAPSRR